MREAASNAWPTNGGAAATLVLIGGAGDLALRMLLPSLYLLDADGLLPQELRIVAAARQEHPDFVALTRAAVERVASDVDEEAWARFERRLSYRAVDAVDPSSLAALKSDLLPGAVVFYLAVSPDLYGAICAALDTAGLVDRMSRLVMEKPLGRDLASCSDINDGVGAVFAEDQVFRIDHYLGKETVQNLLALRFGNALFEPLWNRLSIDHVQITVAETEGVGDRWPYYDRYGALRDMVQNHVLQLLCLLAMEPPSEFSADAVRDQKVKVLRSLRPIGSGEVAQASVRGQYVAGQGAGYVEERGAASDTETFVALDVRIDNWRWSGVPFYLRTGKRMPERRTEIVVQFRPVPHSVFGGGELEANQLVISLQPKEEVSLRLMHKAPGLDEAGMRLHSLPLRLSTAGDPPARRRIAYERLLLDVIEGKPTLFVRRDEIEAAWRWIDGVTAGWAQATTPPSDYAAGSWGPPEANDLVHRQGRSWRD